MQFLDDSLLPETQDKLVITVAPYGPEWEISDFPEDLPLTMEEHVQKAVDCYNAGATVLHIHVRELDGKGSKRLSKFNELLGLIRARLPDMILQVGGSISFAPEGEGAEAKWLTGAGIQPHFQLTKMPDLETVDRLVRRGHYKGPLNLTWIGIGGGFDGPNPNNFMEFIRRAPDGATITAESVMRNVLPINVMAMAMGMHTRCGNEDTLYGPDGGKITSVQQIEQLVRIAGELGRGVATAKEAREIYKIGVQYNSVEETLAKNGMAPNRERGQRGLPVRYAA